MYRKTLCCTTFYSKYNKLHMHYICEKWMDYLCNTFLYFMNFKNVLVMLHFELRGIIELLSWPRFWPPACFLFCNIVYRCHLVSLYSGEPYRAVMVFDLFRIIIENWKLKRRKSLLNMLINVFKCTNLEDRELYFSSSLSVMFVSLFEHDLDSTDSNVWVEEPSYKYLGKRY